MKNRNKKIVFSIIIVLIAIFGIVGVNALNKNLESKNNIKDEVLLSDDTKENNTNDDEKKEDEAKVKKDNENSKSEDNKKEESKENKEKASEETFNDNSKKDNTNQNKEKNSEVKSEEAKNSNIDKSKTTKNYNNNKNNNTNQKTTKSHQDNKSKTTTKNEIKKQTIELTIVDTVNNKSLFCGQVTLNGKENFNTIMNKFLSNNGVRHINRGGYIAMMYGLAEFNAGPNSGWCYYVNGNKAPVGIAGYIPKSGDKVVWKYLEDGVNN